MPAKRRNAKRKRSSKRPRTLRKLKRKSTRSSKSKLSRNKRVSYVDARVSDGYNRVLPDSMRVTMPYFTDIPIVGALTSMFSTSNFRVNYPSDPSANNISATHDYTANGLSLYATMYRRARVVNAKVTVEFRSTFDDTTALDVVPNGWVGIYWGGSGIIQNFPTAQDLLYDSKRVHRNAVFKKVNFTKNAITYTGAAGSDGQSSSNIVATFTKKLNMKKLARQQKMTTLNDGVLLPDVDEYNLSYKLITAPAAPPPFLVEVAAFAIGMPPLDGGAGVNSLPYINATVKIEYDVMLTMPIVRGATRVEDFLGEGNNVNDWVNPAPAPAIPVAPTERMVDLLTEAYNAQEAHEAPANIIIAGYA